MGDALGTIRIVKGERDGSWFDSEPYFEIDKQYLIDNGLGLWTDGKEYYFSEEEAESKHAEFCIEVRDPNFAVMDDKILLTFFTRLPWDSYFGGYTYLKSDENSDYTYGRTYLMYSEDGGNTWSPPTEISCCYLDRGSAKRGNIAVLSSNTVLIPLYGYNKNMDNTFTTANVLAVFNSGKWEFQDEYSIHSENNYLTCWAFETRVTEVSFTRLAGNLYALCRPMGDVLFSTDNGESWENVQTLGKENIILEQPSLQAIEKTSQIVSSWSEPNEAGGRDIFLYLYSPNYAWRYDDKYCIYKNEKAGDMGDPTSIFLEDGGILTIYYDVQKGIVACTRTETSKLRINRIRRKNNE